MFIFNRKIVKKKEIKIKMVRKMLKTVAMLIAVLTVSVVFAACSKENPPENKVTETSSSLITREQLQDILNDGDLIDADAWAGMSISLSLKMGSTADNLSINTTITVVYDKNGNVLFNIPEIGRAYYDNTNAKMYVNIGNAKVYADLEELDYIAPLLGDSLRELNEEKTAGDDLEIDEEIFEQITEVADIVLKTYSDGTMIVSVSIDGEDLLDFIDDNEFGEEMGIDASMFSNSNALLNVYLSSVGAITKIELSSENAISAGEEYPALYAKMDLTLTPYNAAITTPWTGFKETEYQDINEFGEFIVDKYETQEEDLLKAVKKEIYDGLSGAEINVIEDLFLTEDTSKIVLPSELIIDKVIEGVKRYINTVWYEFNNDSMAA
jgi:hypothetical protein